MCYNPRQPTTGEAQFGAVVQAAARAARGDQGAREAVEAAFEAVTKAGLMLADPSRRLWDGERDMWALKAAARHPAASQAARVYAINLFKILTLDDRDAAGLTVGLPPELARRITALLAELGE